MPLGPRNLMGDCQNDPLRVDFDRQIKLEFHCSSVTSDAGLLAYRELDDALQLTNTAATRLQDTRTGQNTQHSLLALLRQSIYSPLAGYEDVNDAERLCIDPALRTIVGGQAKHNPVGNARHWHAPGRTLAPSRPEPAYGGSESLPMPHCTPISEPSGRRY